MAMSNKFSLDLSSKRWLSWLQVLDLGGYVYTIWVLGIWFGASCVFKLVPRWWCYWQSVASITKHCPWDWDDATPAIFAALTRRWPHPHGCLPEDISFFGCPSSLYTVTAKLAKVFFLFKRWFSFGITDLQKASTMKTFSRGHWTSWTLAR